MIDKVPQQVWFLVLGVAVIAVLPFLSSLNLDDVCYGSLLLFCTVFGHFYRKLTEPFLKQWVATIVGFSVVLIVSGVHVLRPLGVTLANALFITMFKKYCHILSFIFTFGFMTLFRTTDYFGQPYLPGPVNLVNMVLTMRMVAVSFDAHDTYVARKKKLPPTPQDIDPGFLDIFHYAFCYVGVLTGPFFRYKTYSDLINTPFSSAAKSGNVLISRLKMLPVFVVAFVVVSKLYPLKEAHTDEFYSERSLLYRLYYMNINFFIFRMRMYTGILLSESVCIAAGLGAYPIWSKARLGTGPTERHDDLAALAKNHEQVMKEEYNFEAVRNLDWYLCEVEPTVRSAMKSWNMSVQYWLAAYVYKRFPVKPMRTLATFIMSALWHGTYIGYYLCIVSVAPYLMVEDVYDKKFRQPSGSIARRIWDVVFWVCRLQAFAYMSITFQLLTVAASLRYWRSLHYLYHWIWLALAMYPLSLTIRSLMRGKKKPE